jgi:hypothetical protein
MTLPDTHHLPLRLTSVLEASELPHQNPSRTLTFIQEVVIALQHLFKLAIVSKVDKNMKSGDSDEPIMLEKFQLFYYVNSVLRGIYRLAIFKETLSEVNRETLGPLLVALLPSISRYVNQETAPFTSYNILVGCQVRSGLQFLLDDYGNFPTISRHVGEATLQSYLERWRQSNELALAAYDNRFVEFKSDSKERYSVKDIYEEEVERLPLSHVWWYHMMMEFSHGKKDVVLKEK